jgi:hypothetical protein
VLEKYTLISEPVKGGGRGAVEVLDGLSTMAGWVMIRM